MKNYKNVKFGGTNCFCDAFIMDEHTHFISLYGSQESVKAITAGFLIEKNVITCDEIPLKRDDGASYFRRQVQLSRALSHTIIFSSEIISSAARYPIIMGSYDEAVQKSFTVLDRITDIPLLPGWINDLSTLFTVKECQVFGIEKAFRFVFPEDDELVTFLKENRHRLALAA